MQVVFWGLFCMGKAEGAAPGCQPAAGPPAKHMGQRGVLPGHCQHHAGQQRAHGYRAGLVGRRPERKHRLQEPALCHAAPWCASTPRPSRHVKQRNLHSAQGMSAPVSQACRCSRWPVRYCMCLLLRVHEAKRIKKMRNDMSWTCEAATHISLHVLQGTQECAGKYHQGCRRTVPLQTARDPRPCTLWTSARHGSTAPRRLMRARP